MKKHSAFSNLYVADHPVILHYLSMMRETSCQKPLFGLLLKKIGMMMGYEMMRDAPVATRPIETPLTAMDAPCLSGAPPVIVPILRAGLGMSEGLEELLPAASVGHIGLYRDHETARPVEYLVKLPVPEGRAFILVDPMLATGYSAKYALDVLVRHGVKPADISLMTLVAAPEGVRVLLDSYPDVRVYVAALDDRLNEKSYIVPGLGDAGDRLFGTA